MRSVLVVVFSTSVQRAQPIKDIPIIEIQWYVAVSETFTFILRDACLAKIKLCSLIL